MAGPTWFNVPPPPRSNLAFGIFRLLDDEKDVPDSWWYRIALLALFYEKERLAVWDRITCQRIWSQSARYYVNDELFEGSEAIINMDTQMHQYVYRQREHRMPIFLSLHDDETLVTSGVTSYWTSNGSIAETVWEARILMPDTRIWGGLNRIEEYSLTSSVIRFFRYPNWEGFNAEQISFLFNLAQRYQYH